jgi:hypothetical protein
MQERTVYSCSEETNYECQVGKETRACTVEEKIEENVTWEEVEEKKEMGIMKPLLIALAVIVPIVSGVVYMLFFAGVKKCPACDSRMRLEYKGERVISYICDTCKYRDIRSTKVKK